MATRRPSFSTFGGIVSQSTTQPKFLQAVATSAVADKMQVKNEG